MAYLIRRSESAADEVRRVLVEQNLKALSLLELWERDPRDQVHAARQAFKRQRALLRLVRPVARYVYAIENRFYRDLARSLAYVRDIDAVVEAVTFLEASVTAPDAMAALQGLRTSLQRRAERELADPVLDVPRRVRSACDALRDATGRLRRTPLPDVSRKVLRASVRKAMSRCQAAFGQVLMTGAAADFHAWRRDVKCAYHQSRLMEELMPDWAAAYGPPLAQLSELLGHNQDLAVLGTLLEASAVRFNPGEHAPLLRRAISARQEALQDEARQLGVLVFLQREPPQAAGPPSPGVAPADGQDAAAGADPPADAAEAPRPSLPDNLIDFAARKAGGDEPA